MVVLGERQLDNRLHAIAIYGVVVVSRCTRESRAAETMTDKVCV